MKLGATMGTSGKSDLRLTHVSRSLHGCTSSSCSRMPRHLQRHAAAMLTVSNVTLCTTCSRCKLTCLQAGKGVPVLQDSSVLQHLNAVYAGYGGGIHDALNRLAVVRLPATRKHKPRFPSCFNSPHVQPSACKRGNCDPVDLSWGQAQPTQAASQQRRRQSTDYAGAGGR